MPFCLFIVKQRQDYGTQSFNNSLLISAEMISSMLQLNGHPSAVVEAKDQNAVQALVTQYSATTVILEAIWVTPAKMLSLQQANPSVRWVVRINSEVPFLAAEGNSIAWIHQYLAQGVTVGFNSDTALADFQVFAGAGAMTWLPNYYPATPVRPPGGISTHIKIGCFGAIRQLKNQLLQAFAAVKFGKLQSRPVSFYMNDGKVEPGNEGIIPAVRSLLQLTGNELILNPWLGHAEFLTLVRSMDIGLQCSFTESFSMVAADFVSLGVPLVGSHAVRWLPAISQADASSADSIVAGMLRSGPQMIAENHQNLVRYTQTSIGVWNNFLGWN
jgi:hypothetical protein